MGVFGRFLEIFGLWVVRYIRRHETDLGRAARIVLCLMVGLDCCMYGLRLSVLVCRKKEFFQSY